MFVNQLAYFIAIRDSIYAEQVATPFCSLVGEDIRRLDSVLWAVKLGTGVDGEYSDCMDSVMQSFEKVLTSFNNRDHAALLSYLTQFKVRCRHLINELNAE